MASKEEQAITDLAIALGMWIAGGMVSGIQRRCYIESVLILGLHTKVNHEYLVSFWGPYRVEAEEILERLLGSPFTS